MVIWFGAGIWFGPGTVANVVTFGTPPMKKLPWSSMTSGFLRNFLVLLLSWARTLAAVATRRTAEHRHLPTRCRKRRSHVMELSSWIGERPGGACGHRGARMEATPRDRPCQTSGRHHII